MNDDSSYGDGSAYFHLQNLHLLPQLLVSLPVVGDEVDNLERMHLPLLIKDLVNAAEASISQLSDYGVLLVFNLQEQTS